MTKDLYKDLFKILLLLLFIEVLPAKRGESSSMLQHKQRSSPFTNPCV